jgi:hypothetical protein
LGIPDGRKPEALDFTGTFNPIGDGEIVPPYIIK